MMRSTCPLSDPRRLSLREAKTVEYCINVNCPGRNQDQANEEARPYDCKLNPEELVTTMAGEEMFVPPPESLYDSL